MKHIIIFSIMLLLSTSIRLYSQDNLTHQDSSDSKIELGAVIVEASRNESKLLDLPVSISSLRTSQIESNQIQNLENLKAYIPNFIMLSYGTKLTSPVYIRGIGSKKGFPSVGLYVDGIPHYDYSSFNFDFYDLHSIEVLRGPQGTLYGRNSMAGLVNINTLSPENYQGTRINLTANSHKALKTTASYYGKINDKIFYSFAGYYNYEQGYIKNEYLNQMCDKGKSYGIRNRIILHLKNNLSLENIIFAEISGQKGFPFRRYIDTLNTFESVNYNHSSGYDRAMLNDGLKLKYKKKSWILESTLSTQLITDNQYVDQDFTPMPIAFVAQDQNQKLFSGELIARSNNKRKYQWLIGTFGFEQFLDKSVDVKLNKKGKNIHYLKNYDLQIFSYGLFHQSTLQITKNFKITAGLRYNYENTKLKYRYEIERKKEMIKKTDTVYPYLNEHILLPKISFSYFIGKKLTLYASYATGYKPGGFNSTFERPSDLQYSKELSHNIESGVKNEAFNGLIYWDLAFFMSFIEGQQIARSVHSGRGTFLQNAGKSRNMGIELSAKTRKIRGFETAISYGYTNAKIIKYEKNDSINYNHHIAPYVPMQTLYVMGAKEIKITNLKWLKSVKLQVDFQYIGKHYWQIENVYAQNPYGLLNAIVSLRNKNISIDFWAKNLTNTDYNAYMVNAMGNIFYQKGRELKAGISLNINF